MLIINAKIRINHGKGASRRLRLANKLPAVIYGGCGKEGALAIELNHDNILNTHKKDGFYSEVMILIIDGKEIKVKIQAVQYHPFKQKFIHMDFIRLI